MGTCLERGDTVSSWPAPTHPMGGKLVATPQILSPGPCACALACSWLAWFALMMLVSQEEYCGSPDWVDSTMDPGA